MLKNRIDDYMELEKIRNSNLLVYITGDRPGLETQIHQEVFDYFVNHLDLLEVRNKKISLFLYTRGGNTLAAWSIVNLIRQFCDEFEVIVPSKALSAGTLMALGANGIVMTKQATLGPIDPSINTALNPQAPGGPPNARVPVSVEAIKGFIELAKDELNVKDEAHLTSILIKLAEMVHPLVLGEVYRARTQIQMLARKLMANQITDPEKIERIISFLCSDSGSHDYTINRKEAKEFLGLNIIKPDDQLYSLIKKIYDNIAAELKLNSTYDPNYLLGQDSSVAYSFRRCLIESIKGGTDVFLSEGIITKQQLEQPIMPGVPQGIQLGIPPQVAIRDDRKYEGWRHEDV